MIDILEFDESYGVTEKKWFKNSRKYPYKYIGYCHKQCYDDVILVKGDRIEYNAPVYICSSCGYAYILPSSPRPVKLKGKRNES